MQQFLSISGSTTAPNLGVILFARPDSLIVKGNTCAGEDVFLLAEPQRGYQRSLMGAIVVHDNPLPKGQAVVWREAPRQGAKKKMCSELERFIDRVIVPILVARYINRSKAADRVEAAQ
jgi:hypothetical protein